MGKASRIANREARSDRQLTRFVCGWCLADNKSDFAIRPSPVRLTWNQARKDWDRHNRIVHNHRLGRLKGNAGFQTLMCDNSPRGPLVTQIR
jgi:hypothetical protein